MLIVTVASYCHNFVGLSLITMLLYIVSYTQLLLITLYLKYLLAQLSICFWLPVHNNWNLQNRFLQYLCVILHSTLSITLKVECLCLLVSSKDNQRTYQMVFSLPIYLSSSVCFHKCSSSFGKLTSTKDCVWIWVNIRFETHFSPY